MRPRCPLLRTQSCHRSRPLSSASV